MLLQLLFIACLGGRQFIPLELEGAKLPLSTVQMKVIFTHLEVVGHGSETQL